MVWNNETHRHECFHCGSPDHNTQEHLTPQKAHETANLVSGLLAAHYPKPSLTVDLVITRGPDILLIQRGKEPYMGSWALPGGFVNQGEEPVEAAVRELREETGVVAERDSLRLVDVFGKADRDPRGWVVAVAYTAEVPAGTEPQAGDDAAKAEWVFVPAIERGDITLAFDHIHIVRKAIA